jgi:hypothetical protein
MPVIINGTTGLSGVSTVNLANGSVTQNILANGVAGTGPAFFVYLGTNQGASSGSTSKINLDTEVYDTANNFAGYRFTPTVAGYYFNALNVSSPGAFAQPMIFKNGSAFIFGAYAGEASVCSGLIYCNGTTDYIEYYVYVNANCTLSAGQVRTYVSGFLARAA